MPHHHIERTIPPIEQVFGDFSAFRAQKSKQAALLLELRGAAQRLRQAEPVSFYSMREVSAHFAVHLRSVAIVYNKLESEGLFVRLRGSQTLIAGHSDNTQSPVRAVVGLPLWLPGLAICPFQGEMQIELDGLLRKAGYVVDTIFFRSGEDSQPDFTERILRQRLDIVMWHSPSPLSDSTLLSLNDRGMRQVFIQPEDIRQHIRSTIYVQHWQDAYEKLADDWRAHGVRKAIVPEAEEIISTSAQIRLIRTFQTRGIEMQVIRGNAQEFMKVAGELCTSRQSGLVFMDPRRADEICNGQPYAVEKLMKTSRVAFGRGRVRIPYFTQRDLRVDLVSFDPREIARFVVQDFAKASIGITDDVRHIFPAKYASQVLGSC